MEVFAKLLGSLLALSHHSRYPGLATHKEDLRSLRLLLPAWVHTSIDKWPHVASVDKYLGMSTKLQWQQQQVKSLSRFYSQPKLPRCRRTT